MTGITVGFAMCGSFCTFSKAFAQMEQLKNIGYHIVPIMSFNAYSTDTAFGKAEDYIKKAEEICQRKVIHTIKDAEPIGPKGMTDIMLVSPCTGNTAAKLAGAVTDTPVTMAVKSHLRQSKPVLLCIATNDALGASAQNIGKLMNTRHYYFVPFSQDNPLKKPNSLVADFAMIPEALEYALKEQQIQPVIGSSAPAPAV